MNTSYKKVGIVACSNGQKVENAEKIKVGETLQIAVTREIGHGTDAKAIEIGKEYRFL